MRKNLLVLFVTLALLTIGGAVNPVEAAENAGAGIGGPGAGVDIGFFYGYLSPFGTWVEFSPWGYVWCPTEVGIGWHPFTNGRWLWTDDGWLWVSSYEWGWCPFHYGRWGWDEHLGWFWVPGTAWSPAWVTWRWGGSYVGWAPLPPDVEFGVGVGITFLPEIPSRFWCFTDGRRFLDRDLDRYIIPIEMNRDLLERAGNKGNISFEGGRIFDPGVHVNDVHRWSNRNIVRYHIENGERPGEHRVGSGSVRLYRPSVVRNEGARPRSFLPREEAVRRVPQIRMERRSESARNSGRNLEQELKQRQERETQLMRQSQEQERMAQRRAEQEQAARAANQAERERINREAQQRNGEMQRRENEQKDQMRQRHQQEQQRTSGRPGR